MADRLISGITGFVITLPIRFVLVCFRHTCTIIIQPAPNAQPHHADEQTWAVFTLLDTSWRVKPGAWCRVRPDDLMHISAPAPHQKEVWEGAREESCLLVWFIWSLSHVSWPEDNGGAESPARLLCHGGSSLSREMISDWMFKLIQSCLHNFFTCYRLGRFDMNWRCYSDQRPDHTQGKTIIELLQNPKIILSSDWNPYIICSLNF